MPTFPFAKTVNKEDVAKAADVVEAMLKSGDAEPKACWI
jgi:hypothetical protein